MYSLQHKTTEDVVYTLCYGKQCIHCVSFKIQHVRITKHSNTSSPISQNLERFTFLVISLWRHLWSQNQHNERYLSQVFPLSPQFCLQYFMAIRQIRRSLLKPSWLSAGSQKWGRDIWAFLTLQRESRRGFFSVPGKGNEALRTSEEDQMRHLSLSSELERYFTLFTQTTSSQELFTISWSNVSFVNRHDPFWSSPARCWPRAEDAQQPSVGWEVLYTFQQLVCPFKPVLI